MCNLCSPRLFLVPNPCCCCDLRCGVMWVGVFEVVVGLISLYFPSTLSSIEWKALNSERPGGAEQDDVEEPVFDVIVPWSESPFFQTLQRTGCYTIQIFLGVIILCAANGLGGHNFAKFIIGCMWLIIRVITMLIMLFFSRKLSATKHAPLTRYSVYITLKMFLDIYFVVVIRYWTMDCYDSYRYNRTHETHNIRRVPPVTFKSAPVSDAGKKCFQFRKKKGKKEGEVEVGSHVPQIIKDIHQKKKQRHFHDVEPAPVWDRKNEVIFYGEDYTDWDPQLFQSRWEILDEKSKGTGRKSLAESAMESFRGEGDDDTSSKRNSGKSNVKNSIAISTGATSAISGGRGRKSTVSSKGGKVEPGGARKSIVNSKGNKKSGKIMPGGAQRTGGGVGVTTSTTSLGGGKGDNLNLTQAPNPTNKNKQKPARPK